ncbi:hypothetical protein ACIBG8_26135 [Nonomuraea sp. NPDC050556]|uniref:hypothetical protein n=1 Tax=Nonomuraea sp. NPDC050556 TaxID=3364369 RepID=UPI0037A8DDC6
MSLATALALLALLVSVFAILAVGALYSRLRMMEHTVLRPGSTRLSDEPRAVPPALRPRQGQEAALVLLLDGACSVCHLLWDAARPIPGTRVLALFAGAESAEAFEGTTEKVVDPDLWSAIYEGYTPCVYMIDSAGQLTDRRFVYGDTDLSELFQGSSHAS